MIEADRGRQDDDRGPAPLPGELPSAKRRRRGRPRPAWVDRLGSSPELLVGLPAVAIFVFWASAQGGVAATDSWPAALLLLGLLAVTAYAYRDRLGALPPLVLAGMGLLAAFTVWNFLSIGWADDQGAAWDGANRVLMYLTVFGIFAIPAWRPGAGALLLGVYTLAIAVVGAIVLLKAAGSANPLQYFVAGRFAEPTGYQNANAALFTISMFPAIFLASRRETPWPARGLMLACAGLLFQLALMPQSRGWLIAAPLALIAYLVLVPGLVRSLTVILPLGAVLALSASPVIHVFDVSNDPSSVGPALHDARSAMIVSALVLLAIGCLIGYLDRRLELSERVVALGTRVVLAGAGVVALAAAVVAIAVIGNPVSWASDRWHDFKGGRFEYQTGGGTRLGQGLGSNRYDFWRVAANEFTDRPLVGVGSENFAEDYVRDRRSDEEPTYPHNLPLQVISETGVVGGLLYGAFLAVALVGVGRVRLRSGNPLGRGLAGIAAVVFFYWFVHSIGDWFWAFPALTAPVFAWLAMGMRLDGERGPVGRSRWAKRWATPATVVLVAAGLCSAASFLLPWMAALDVRNASLNWGSNPREAFDRLDRARGLNFLSAQPDLVAGAIASRLDQPRRVRSSFGRALERDPRNWYATLELAALDGVEGDKQSALQGLDRVAELNPREPLTATVRQGVVSGRPVTLQALDAAFLERYCQRLGRSPAPNGGCA